MRSVTKTVVILLSVAGLACSESPSSPTTGSAQDGVVYASGGGAAGTTSPRLGLLTAGQPRAYRLKGTADVVEVDGALCYTVDLWDVVQDRIVGAATDCLSDIDAAGAPDAVVLTGRTTFDFGKGNSFTSEGRTSVRATMPGSSLDFTHITGAIPAEGSNSIIAGTGRFDGFEATVRLSGAVNLTLFPATITFDCLFIVTPI